MKREPIKPHWFIWIIVAAGFLASILLYSKLPEQMPMHWNAAGEIDRYGSRLEGAFLMPLLNAGILLLLIWLPALDPRRKSYEKFESFYKIIQWVMVIFFTGVHVLILFSAMGYQISIGLFVKLGIGILFMILGNYMGKVRSNWFVGIKNPWTLENEEVWVRTHRMAGPLMFWAGVVIFLMAFVDNYISLWVVIIVSMALALVPNIYSYILYRKLTK